MAQTPEGKVKAAVKKLLNSRGIWYYLPMQNGMGVVGIPDFVCCNIGYFLTIETKAPGKRANVTPNQKARMREIRAAGGITLVIDDVQQLKEYLDGREEESESEVEVQEPSVKARLQKRVRKGSKETDWVSFRAE